MRIRTLAALGALTLFSLPALAAETAPTPENPPLPTPAPKSVADPAPLPPEVDACRASGLLAVKQRAPAVKTIEIDPDTVSVSKVDTMIEQTRVRTVVLGQASIDTAHQERPNQFVCLIGDGGKVLMTFFTQK